MLVGAQWLECCFVVSSHFLKTFFFVESFILANWKKYTAILLYTWYICWKVITFIWCEDRRHCFYYHNSKGSRILCEIYQNSFIKAQDIFHFLWDRQLCLRMQEQFWELSTTIFRLPSEQSLWTEWVGYYHISI